MPDALRQLGLDVTLLTESDLAQGDLSRFDAIVAGVRAYNVRNDLRANQPRLMKYVENGGTYVVQYQSGEGGGRGPGPRGRGSRSSRRRFRRRISGRTRSRFPRQQPVAGHGRRCAGDVPASRQPLAAVPESHHREGFSGLGAGARAACSRRSGTRSIRRCSRRDDPGEKPLEGGELWTHYGKGVYIFTATRGSGNCRPGCRGRIGCSRIC